MKKWSNEIKSLLNSNFGSNTYWEQDYWDNGNYSYTWKMTPYQTVTASGDYLVPNQEITPGWSGANYIPLKVQSGAKQVSVSFYPNGSNSNNTNMNFLICYRATDGTPVYSEPITGEGTATLRLDKTPSSTGGTQMVFAVVVNTDYQYTGNTEIRKKHFDYKLKLESGISGAGDAYTKYYNDFKLDYKWPEIGDSPVSSSSSSATSSSNSSSSVKSSSSQVPASSSSVVVSGATTYEMNVTLPIDENYATVKATFDVAEVAAKLGLTAATISQATFFAQEPDGSIITKSTATEPGNWFGKDGSVVEWGEDAYVFSEADVAKGTLAVGHYPNRVNNAESYNFIQGLSYNGKSVLFKVKVTITNDKSSDGSETTTALMYGLNGPATHMNLVYKNGMLNVHYALPQNDNVKISLFSGFGALLDQKITGLQGAGAHTHAFDLRRMPRGTYIVKISTGSYREAKPVSILR
jgi:hypothetical protein